jgi:hypothetical protein
MKRFSMTVVCTAIASLAALWGCEGTTRQGTLYRMQADRELEIYLAGELDAVYQAALEVIETEYGYTVEESGVDAREGLVRARTALGHEVRVEMYRYSDPVTRVEAYAGPRGNEAATAEVLSAIEARLAAP